VAHPDLIGSLLGAGSDIGDMCACAEELGVPHEHAVTTTLAARGQVLGEDDFDLSFEDRNGKSWIASDADVAKFVGHALQTKQQFRVSDRNFSEDTDLMAMPEAIA
jgi:hypothetical protein